MDMNTALFLAICPISSPICVVPSLTDQHSLSIISHRGYAILAGPTELSWSFRLSSWTASPGNLVNKGSSAASNLPSFHAAQAQSAITPYCCKHRHAQNFQIVDYQEREHRHFCLANNLCESVLSRRREKRANPVYLGAGTTTENTGYRSPRRNRSWRTESKRVALVPRRWDSNAGISWS
jgi:hypothetical protein